MVHTNSLSPCCALFGVEMVPGDQKQCDSARSVIVNMAIWSLLGLSDI